MAQPLPFEDVAPAERAEGEPALLVDVDGFEGPLDLLLELARRQKVDLHRISILALAEQYLVFVEEARRLRLGGIRGGARQLGGRAQLGGNMFGRGAPEPVQIRRQSEYGGTLYDLLAAYGRQRQIRFNARVTLHKRHVWSLVDAREALERLIGQIGDWVTLDSYLICYMVEPAMRPTVMASALSATLEMVREGHMVLRQDEPFAPLWIRPVAGEPEPAEA